MKKIFLILSMMACSKPDSTTHLSDKNSNRRNDSISTRVGATSQSQKQISIEYETSSSVYADTVFQDYSYKWKSYISPTDTSFVIDKVKSRFIIDTLRLHDSMSVEYYSDRTHAYSFRLSFLRNDKMNFSSLLNRHYPDSVYGKDHVLGSGASAPEFVTFLSKLDLIVIRQGFYKPETDIGGSFFYIYNIEGNVVACGRMSYRSFDFSPSRERLVTLEHVYDLSSLQTKRVDHDWIAAKFINDSLIVGFTRSEGKGKAVLYDLALNGVDSISFNGFIDDMYLFAQVEKGSKSNTIIAYDNTNAMVHIFSPSYSRPRSIQRSELRRLPNRLSAVEYDELSFYDGQMRYYFYCNKSEDCVGFFEEKNQ